MSGYHIREAGATALQELAFTLRDGVEYVKYGIERGMDVDEFVPRISFFFNAHNDFFEEICQISCGARCLGKDDERAFRRQKSKNDADAFSHPNCRSFFDRSTAFE